jgi:hypothetical protein
VSRRAVLSGLLVATSVAACSSSSPLKSSFPVDAGTDGGKKSEQDATAENRDAAMLLTAGDAGGCATLKKQAHLAPVNLALGIDTSFSMDFESKWVNLSAALDAFVGDPASSGLNLGLQFFPLDDTCAVSAYEALAVPVGPRATVAPLIEHAIAAQRPAGGTPTVQLLEGLIATLRTNTDAGAGVKPVIVLATDGVPDSTCLYAPDGGTPNSLANAEAIAKQAFSGTPSIPVFVIGVGSDLTALNGLAAAGGTGTATLVGVDLATTEAAFVTALNTIREQSLPCNLTLPEGTTGDPTETNVAYAPGSGATQSFVYVGSAATCAMAPNNGWYFDDPNQPTEVILCPGACHAISADPEGTVDVVLGCPRADLK